MNDYEIRLANGGVILVDTDGKGSGSVMSRGLRVPGDGRFNEAIDGIELMALNHACAGIKISKKEYVKGLVDSICDAADRFPEPGVPEAVAGLQEVDKEEE